MLILIRKLLFQLQMYSATWIKISLPEWKYISLQFITKYEKTSQFFTLRLALCPHNSIPRLQMQRRNVQTGKQE